ncbi:MAG: serpin family protein [Myxococcota bacterium]
MAADAATSINAFAIDFHRQALATGNASNLVFSPASISMAFGMAFGGSNGETAEELARAFHFPPAPRGDAATIHHGFSGLLTDWDTLKQLELTIANRLYGEQSEPIDPEFIEFTDSAYRAPLVTMDFRHDADGSRRSINAWVAEQTRDRIVEVLPEGSVSSETRLTLVNAIYFKAGWHRPFMPGKTRPQAFHTPRGDVEVPMMRSLMRSLAYAEDPDAGVDFVQLPYLGDRLAMLIVRPTEPTGLASVEAGLSEATLARWVETLEDRSAMRAVQVGLPKFKLTPPSISLRKTLNAMGVHRAFEAHRAEFYGMLPGNKGLYIHDAYHQAFIEVDEQGTEAAAATADMMVPTSMPQDPAEFIVDRPFLFFVRDRVSGAVLFMGRVVDPTA